MSNNFLTNPNYYCETNLLDFVAVILNKSKIKAKNAVTLRRKC